MRKIEFHCNPVEGSTGFYREIPVMKTGTLQWGQGFPVIKTGFSLWELIYREFPVSIQGLGLHFAVREETKFIQS